MDRNWNHGRPLWRACGIAAALVGILGPAGAAPKLSLPTPRVDIGELTAGETAEVEFPLVNAGTEPLVIRKVQASCSCTTTSYPATLPPGEKGVLKAKLVSAPDWDGPIEKHFTVTSNDPEQPSATMALVARIRPLYRVFPRSPFSVKYRRGTVVRQVFTITATGEAPFRVTGVEPAPGVEARLLPAARSDGPGLWRVEVTVRPPEQGGDFLGLVTLPTTHPRLPSIPIIVHCLTPGITVSPPNLYLRAPASAPGADPIASLILSRRAGTFRVLEIRADTPALKITVKAFPLLGGGPTGDETGSGSSFYQVDCYYLGGLKKGKHTGQILITTDDPASPKIEIPYEAMVD